MNSSDRWRAHHHLLALCSGLLLEKKLGSNQIHMSFSGPSESQHGSRKACLYQKYLVSVVSMARSLALATGSIYKVLTTFIRDRATAAKLNPERGQAPYGTALSDGKRERVSQKLQFLFILLCVLVLYREGFYWQSWWRPGCSKFFLASCPIPYSITPLQKHLHPTLSPCCQPLWSLSLSLSLSHTHPQKQVQPTTHCSRVTDMK